MKSSACLDSAAGSVSPVQVRGGRWFVAMLNREMEEGGIRTVRWSDGEVAIGGQVAMAL